jgi:hypothetical protein
MSETTICIHVRDPGGLIKDIRMELTLDELGGVLPSVGDLIISPVGKVDADGTEGPPPAIWTVVARVFRLAGQEDCIGLVVEQRALNGSDQVFLS